MAGCVHTSRCGVKVHGSYCSFPSHSLTLYLSYTADLVSRRCQDDQSERQQCCKDYSPGPLRCNCGTSSHLRSPEERAGRVWSRSEVHRRGRIFAFDHVQLLNRGSQVVSQLDVEGLQMLLDAHQDLSAYLFTRAIEDQAFGVRSSFC